MFITPAMIPHEQFHLGIWLTSVENPCWYYFLKKKNTNIISNNSFMESVDPPLRKLVKFLHDHTIRTTPSCSGHYKNSSAFQKIYSILEEDRQKILHQGLLLKDVETGKTHLYQNKHYQLPWREQDFISQALEYQHRGIIGMRLGNRVKLRQKIHQVIEHGIDFKEKDTITFIIVDKENPQENLAAWARITDYIEEIFTPDYKSASYV